MIGVNEHCEPGTPIKRRFSDFLSRDKKLVPDRITQYGLHPVCRRCKVRRKGNCRYPQYNAPNLQRFVCMDR